MPWTPKRVMKHELTGQRFGLLTVIKEAPKVELECEIRSAWTVKCDCGEEQNVITRYLTRGGKTSCGKPSCKMKWRRIEAEKERGEDGFADAPGL